MRKLSPRSERGRKMLRLVAAWTMVQRVACATLHLSPSVLVSRCLSPASRAVASTVARITRSLDLRHTRVCGRHKCVQARMTWAVPFMRCDLQIAKRWPRTRRLTRAASARSMRGRAALGWWATARSSPKATATTSAARGIRTNKSAQKLTVSSRRAALFLLRNWTRRISGSVSISRSSSPWVCVYLFVYFFI